MSCQRTQYEDFEELLVLSKSPNASERLLALKEFCPCKVRKEVDQVWTRVLQMTDDPDDRVRYQVLHTLCDGSPREREEEIISSLEGMWNDKNEKIRKQVRQRTATGTSSKGPLYCDHLFTSSDNLLFLGDDAAALVWAQLALEAFKFWLVHTIPPPLACLLVALRIRC
ncbi:HEAT repeat domain-containing protein [Balamuthia mandrillaris]